MAAPRPSCTNRYQRSILGPHDAFDDSCNFTETEGSFSATVLVDGLSNQTEVRHFTHILRSLRITIRKVRGMKDESNSLIRLADALAGFVRDFIEGQLYQKDLIER